MKYKGRIEGGIKSAESHLSKLDSARSSNPNNYNRYKGDWKKHAKNALNDARKVAEKHLKGKTREQTLQRIRSLEGRLSGH